MQLWFSSSILSELSIGHDKRIIAKIRLKLRDFIYLVKLTLKNLYHNFFIWFFIFSSSCAWHWFILIKTLTELAKNTIAIQYDELRTNCQVRWETIILI